MMKQFHLCFMFTHRIYIHWSERNWKAIRATTGLIHNCFIPVSPREYLWTLSNWRKQWWIKLLWINFFAGFFCKYKPLISMQTSTSALFQQLYDHFHDLCSCLPHLSIFNKKNPLGKSLRLSTWVFKPHPGMNCKATWNIAWRATGLQVIKSTINYFANNKVT